MAPCVKQKWSQLVRGGDGRVAEQFGIDPVAARVILNRGISDEEQIRRFLYGTLEDLEDPRLMDGADRAVSLLHECILQKQKIRIIGDYDADGVFSTYILYHSLQTAGGDVSFEIPDRVRDGFGLSMRLVENAHQDGVGLMITCDNGIAQTEEVSRAKQLGMTVIITDHHEPNFTLDEEGKRQYCLPEADAVVDPKKPNCPYPNKDLCGAGVVWKLMLLYERRYLIRRDRLSSENSFDPDPVSVSGESSGPDPSPAPLKECPLAMENLPFAAAATITDIMSLLGENRILVKYGLKMLRETDNAGMRALIRRCSLEGKRLTPGHIGFIIGPCLNASGRLDSAMRAVSLLLETDPVKAASEAEYLAKLNDERKMMTEEGKKAAFDQIETTGLIHDRVLIIYLKGVHESVAGIIASKVKDAWNRPVIIFTDTVDPDLLKGSGRSIEAYNMHDELSGISDLFLRFGGHPMAAGVTIRRDRLDELRARINENCSLTEDDLGRKILLDAVPPFSYLTEDVVRALDILEPFGPGNRAPQFGCSQVRVLRTEVLGKNQNCVKLVVDDGKSRMSAVYFGDADEFLSFLRKKSGRRGQEIRLSLAYRPVINEFRSVRSVQLQIAHFQ